MEPQDNLQQQNPEPQVEDTSIGDSLRRILSEDEGTELDYQPTAPAVEGADPEPEEETQPEGQAEQTPDQNADEFEYELDGGERVKVPAKLKDHLLRQADYSKKTAEVAREREAVQALKQVNEQAYAVAQQLGPLLADFHSTRNELQKFEQIDWDALYEQDPLLHNKLRLDAREKVDKINQLGAVLQKAPEMLERVQQQALASEVARNYPIAKQLVPDFESRKDELAAAGKVYGFSDAELRNSPDARVIKVLADLADYQRLLKERASVKPKIASAPPVARPGPKSAPTGTHKEAQAAARNLRADSSDDAFVAAMRAARKARGG